MNLRNSILSFMLILLLFVGCGGVSEDEDSLVTIQTKFGDITLILYNITPLHKASFLELANKGAYDSTTFHRVIEDFMIQGGNVAVHSDFKKLGSRLIPPEFVPGIIHKRGALGAARDDDNINPQRKSSVQFYIVQGKKFTQDELTTDITKLNHSLGKYLRDGKHEELLQEFMDLQESKKTEEMQRRALELRKDMEETLGESFEKQGITKNQVKTYSTVGGAPHLDGSYTVFGEVLEGMDVVDKIAAVKTDSTHHPIDTIYIKMKVEILPKEEITKRYGMEYPAKSSK